jgi:hypothetical protein
MTYSVIQYSTMFFNTLKTIVEKSIAKSIIALLLLALIFSAGSDFPAQSANASHRSVTPISSSIQITRPSGEEKIKKGSESKIEYTTENISRAYHYLYEKRDNGALRYTKYLGRKTISQDGTQAHTWNVPENLSPEKNYKIRILGITSQNRIGYALSSAFSISSDPQFIFPTNQTKLIEDTIQTIKWEVADTDPDAHVTILLFKADQDVTLKTIPLGTIHPWTSQLTNSGRYTWDMSKGAEPTENTSFIHISPLPGRYKLGIVINSTIASKNPLIVSEPFEITPAPNTEIISPNGGESFVSGERIKIQYKGADKSVVYFHLFKEENTEESIAYMGYGRARGNETYTYYRRLPRNLTGENIKFAITADRKGTKILEDSDTSFSIAAPITITAPDSEDTIEIGQESEIKYVTKKVSRAYHYLYEVRSNGSVRYKKHLGRKNISQDGEQVHKWDVSDNLDPDKTYKIRILGTGRSGWQSVFSDRFEITLPPSINITSHNNSDSIALGSKIKVTWESESIDEDQSMKIALTSTGSIEDAILTVESPNDKEEEFVIPGSVTEGEYHVAVYTEDQSVQDLSDQKVQVALIPALTVSSPTENDVWEQGAVQEIRWTKAELGENVEVVIGVLTPNKEENLTIASTSGDTGVYEWTVGNGLILDQLVITPGDYFVQVIILNKNTKEFKFGESDVFKIVKTNTQIASPNGGEEWEIGSTQKITWNVHPDLANTQVGAINLVSENGDVHNLSISATASSTANDGEYEWIVGYDSDGNQVPAGKYSIKIVQGVVGLSLIEDSSDEQFEITGSHPIETSVGLEVSSDSPESVEKGKESALLARYEISATGESVELEKLFINFDSSTNGTSHLNNATFKLDGEDLPNSNNFLTEIDTGFLFWTEIGFDPKLVMNPDQVYVLEVRADIPEDISLDETIQIRIVPGTGSNAKIINTDETITVPTANVLSNALTIDQPSITPSPTPTPLSQYRVFLTSSGYNGNLGGLAGADLKCQERADSQNLGGTWKAWLSDSITSAASRLFHSPNPYVQLNGTTIANNWSDLTDGTLQKGIDITELGTFRLGGVWTNTKIDGSVDKTDSSAACNDWTDSASTPSRPGLHGSAGTNNDIWTDNPHEGLNPGNCGKQLLLYCIEQ